MKIFLIILLASFLSFPQGMDTLIHYNLGEIEVIAKKENQLNCVEVSSKSFQMLNSFNVFDALQFSPGIYASVSSKNEAQLSIRGFDQRQISVMIDGAPIYIPYDGSFDLNAIQLAGFNKISITKNNSSILYGPNSLGGSINLVSEYPVKPFSANFIYQNGSSQNLTIGLNGILDNFYWNAAFGLSESDGFNLPKDFSATANEDGEKRDNSSYDAKSGMIKVGANLFEKLNLAFALNYIDNKKDVPVNVYTTRPRYWRYPEWNKTLGNIMFGLTTSSSFTLKGNFFYEKFKNVLDSYDDSTYTTQTRRYAFHSTYDENSYGLDLSSYIISKFLPLTKIIFLYKRDTHQQQGNYGLPFEKYEAEIITAGVEEEFSPLDKLKAVIGISYDRMNPLFADDSPLRSSSSFLNGNIGLSYYLNENLKLYSIVSRRSRFPTLKEFYSDLLGSYEPNPDLSAEQSYNYEVGATSEFSGLNISTAVFYSDLRDLIQIVVLADNNRQYQNIASAEFKGIELELRYNFLFVNAAMNYTYLSSKNVSNGTDLPYRPAHALNFLLNKSYRFGFEWNFELSYISTLYSYNTDNGELIRLSDYLLLNAKIAYRLFSDYSIYFRVNNITDQLYESEYGLPQPGREFFVGITAEW